MELVARLEDSHAHLLPLKEQPPRAPLPEWGPGFACLEDDQGRPAVYHLDPGSPADEAGVKVGMVVLTIDDRNALDAINVTMSLYRRYIGYSSRRRLAYDAYRSFHAQMERGTEIRFTMLDVEGEEHKFTLKASVPGHYLPRLPVPIEGIRDSGTVSFKMLEDNVGYIYVRRIRPNLPQELDEAVGSLKDARGLIVDVRGNSGGGFENEALLNFHTGDDHPDPNRPVYKGPIAMLIDGRCISAGEGWASWFVANKRARFFGTATSGASARKIEYTITNGLYKVRLPVRPYRGYLNRIIERRGLEPDVPLKQTAADLAIGRDTVLEAARQYLLDLPDDVNAVVEVTDDPNSAAESGQD
jgi:C-terminal processing protease CtpA/Prc